MELIVAWVVMAVVFGGLGAWVAGQKNRNVGEGLILGGVFGPVGVIVEALLPTIQRPQSRMERIENERRFEIDRQAREAARRMR